MNKILIFIMISFLSFVGILKADGHKPDIVDTAVAAGSFNTLVKAVTAADLVETLKVKVHSQCLHHLTKRFQL